MEKDSIAAVKCWPSEIYDYEQGTITAEGVGGLDIHEGRWILCECCDSELKVLPPFSITGWEAHKKTKTHLMHKEKFENGPSQAHNVSFSQSSNCSTPPAFQKEKTVCSPIARAEELDMLAEIRHDLEIQKHQQRQYEREVKDVIDAMTSLIGDQQNDLGNLRLQIHSMASAMESFRREIADLRQKDRRQKVVQPSQQKPYTAHSFTSKQKTTSRKFSTKIQGDRDRGRRSLSNKKESKYSDVGVTDNSFIDMDIFEKRFHLG
ncbi:hypothetical protein PHYBOEH_003496 [Phytophthora boehmeriae]|uniref:Uncharacterized protein n=1 Tax=Phytophthora boehmeriae TaxID=109152 RepID=A0A8T1X7U6_9STRA|nr:hypothetical protein PHYBOEH_003496 [Phytophthora boehmeriae]